MREVWVGDDFEELGEGRASEGAGRPSSGWVCSGGGGGARCGSAAK